MRETSTLRYALITPAWNEAAHLPELIRSVASQTVLPVAWVIVSDGSTDATDEIVRRASAEHSWIKLLRRERDKTRHFAGKAYAVNAGYQSIASLDFELIGNLDADMTLPPDYYAFLIGRFVADVNLGVAGTPFVEDQSKPDAHTYAHAFADLSHVSGACQFFRRTCFDEIGGYMLAAITFLSLSVCQVNDSFHHVELVQARLSPHPYAGSGACRAGRGRCDRRIRPAH